jgi:hypothetical protein
MTEGSLPLARSIAPQTCVRSVRADWDHDAVMRIGGPSSGAGRFLIGHRHHIRDRRQDFPGNSRQFPVRCKQFPVRAGKIPVWLRREFTCKYLIRNGIF